MRIHSQLFCKSQIEACNSIVLTLISSEEPSLSIFSLVATSNLEYAIIHESQFSINDRLDTHIFFNTDDSFQKNIDLHRGIRCVQIR